MSLLKKISLGVLVFLILLLGTLAFLLGTQTGLHLVLNGAARWVPGLQIASVTGGWRDLTLTGVQYQMPGVTVKSGQFHLSLDLSCFRRSQLCLNAVTAQDVDVVVNTRELAPSTAPAAEEEPGSGNLSTPYPITVRLLRLNNVKVTVDNTAIALGELRTGMQWQERALTLLPTRINSLLVALPTAAQLALEQVAEPQPPTPATPAEPETPLGETLQQLFAKPLLPDLPSFRLPLDIAIPSIRGEQLRLTGDTDITLTSLLVQAHTKDQHLQLDTLDIDSPQGTLNARGQATLSDNWPLAMEVNGTLNVDPLKGEKLKLTANGGLREKLDVALNLSGPVRTDLKVQTQLAEAGLPLMLSLTSDTLRWPLTGEAQYQVKNVAVNFTGKAVDYRLGMHADVSGVGLPPATVTLDGAGNVEQFRLARLRLAALQGNSDLSGVVDWSKAISWNSVLTLNGINTARQWPEWPATLEGKIVTRGSLYGGNMQLRVPELQLNGRVRNNRVEARGQLSGNAAGQWDIPQLHLALGRNTVDVKGKLDENWNLDANINAPQLDNALPGLGGVVNGALQLRGNLKAPQILADLTANRLRWQELRINRVTLKGEVRSGEQIEGDLALRVDQLTQAALAIRQLTLQAKGSEKQHQMQLRIDGKPVSGQLALNGSFDRQTQRWSGTLNNTRFDTPVGEVRLSRAMALEYFNQEQRVTVGPHCWLNPNVELCVPKTIDAGASGQATVQLNRFDLAMVKPFLTEDTQLSGLFTGRADVSWKAGGGLPQAKVTLSGKGVKVRQNVQGNTLPVDFDTLDLNAALVNGRAQLGWLIRIANNGQLAGNVQIADPQGRRNITGNVTISRLSLALLNPALSQGEKAQGMLDANLRLAGNAQRPLVYGQMALDGVDVDGSWMPFDITNGRLGLNFNGNTSTLNGLIQTSQGQIALAGNADWSQIDAWRARIAAKGDKVRVTVPPMVRLDVSPDLVFEATPQLFSLNGNVDIPWARITVQDLPESAVGVSSDEVMLDEQRRPIEAQSASIPIASNLTVNIGNDVRLDAFGLKAQLKGALKVVQDKQGLGLNGQIDIPSGRFHAYGQDLLVRKGQLLFSGPPDQPLLNIEAIRNPDSTADDVVAGVKVTGLADEPKLEIFSDPAMSQEEALSYLLRGQGLDNTGTDSGMMTSMLVGLGVAQSGKLVGKIGEAFGVSNLTLDTAGVGDSSQVVVSGYVLPGLQVKYGVGIFDSLATLTLRYRLMPKLYLEAVSGLDQALDVLYQFEF